MVNLPDRLDDVEWLSNCPFFPSCSRTKWHKSGTIIEINKKRTQPI